MSGGTRPEGIGQIAYPRFTDLADRPVFITGGGSGIGAFLVHAFAMQGAKVAFVSLVADPGEALCEAVAEAGGVRPLFLAADIQDLAALRGAIGEAEARHGAARVLINNAARDDRHGLDDLTPDAWDASLNVNLRPHFFTTQALAPGMRRRGGGAVVNIGSNASLLGLAGYPAYVTAKAGIVGLTRALARELGPHGIRVNAILPGWVLTERQKALWATPESVAQCLAEQALKRTVAAEDIASTALFLASESAAMITGQSLVVDGGRIMA
jgi:NAD(P)-dependent dehydrogenase (short-subunit alcohol dehydrogenase family)